VSRLRRAPRAFGDSRSHSPSSAAAGSTVPGVQLDGELRKRLLAHVRDGHTRASFGDDPRDFRANLADAEHDDVTALEALVVIGDAQRGAHALGKGDLG